MKEMISMILALLVCLGLCACESASGSQGGQEQQNTTAGAVDYAEILCNDIFWSPVAGYRMSAWMEDGTIDNGNVVGTWELNGSTLKCIWQAGKTELFEIRFINDICFLVGEEYSYIDPNVRWDQVPTVSVEITMDNWQQYFEFVTETNEKVIYDVFGEPTGETEKSEGKFLKLKDEYFRALLPGRSELAMRYSFDGNENETKINDAHEHKAVAVGYYGLVDVENTDENPFEMLKIQGTLYFVDGI